MLTHLLQPILNLHGLEAYLLIAALVFGETGIFLGFFVPGETAVVLGGVLAGRHHVSLLVLLLVVVGAAIAGDAVGYLIGRHYGERLMRVRLLERRRARLESAMAFLRRRGGSAVFLGRFVSFLRTVVPGLAGTSQMRPRTFFPANIAGGLAWGIGYALLGVAAGAAYEKVLTYSSWAGEGLLGAVVVAIAGLLLRAHLHRRREAAMSRAEPRDEVGDRVPERAGPSNGGG